jgi:acyl carrier protein
MSDQLSHEQIQALLEDFLSENFDVPKEKMTSQVSLRELGIDSIMMLDIMMEMEDRLGIKLKDLATPAQPKLSDIIALIERNLVASKA